MWINKGDLESEADETVKTRIVKDREMQLLRKNMVRRVPVKHLRRSSTVWQHQLAATSNEVIATTIPAVVQNVPQ